MLRSLLIKKVEIIGYRNDAMLRQITEIIRMNKIPGNGLMNGKREWKYINLPQATVEDTY